MAKSRDGKNNSTGSSGKDKRGRKAASVRPTAKAAAEQEARILELTHTNRQLRRKIFDLYTIFEISRNFSAVLDYKTLLDSFIFTCLGQVGVGRGAIFLRPTLEATRFHMAEGKGSGPLPDAVACFNDDTRLIGYLTQLNRPMPVDELSADIMTRDERTILKMFSGGLIVPLIYQTRLAGLFLVADKISQNDFNADEIEFVSALGNQIAVAIENARLYEGEMAANEQLWEAQRQLVKAERMAALGEVSAMVAHEVNNPLGIIKNYLLLMKRSADEPVQVGEYVNIVSQEIDRIAHIVEELRRFQRPSSVEFSPLALDEMLESTLALAGRQLKAAGIELVAKLKARPARIKGNADHLRQVFLNVILNARAAMDTGGKLTVELDENEKEVVVLLKDTGPGISEKLIPQIFEPFFTTKGEEGSGLGLSISRGIIKSHRGSITFYNTDEGGCFEIRLPRLHEKDFGD